MSFFFFSSRRRHTRSYGDWSSDVCSSDLEFGALDLWLQRQQFASHELADCRQDHALLVGQSEVQGRFPLLSPRSFTPKRGPFPNDRSVAAIAIICQWRQLVENLVRKDPAPNSVRVGQVLETATRLFTERGYEAASIRHLAA